MAVIKNMIENQTLSETRFTIKLFKRKCKKIFQDKCKINNEDK